VEGRRKSLQFSGAGKGVALLQVNRARKDGQTPLGSPLEGDERGGNPVGGEELRQRRE
jgi:hypothetical protein